LSSFALAICGWLLGALGHDAGHYSVSRSPWINNLCVWAMSFLCNPIMWQHQHTFAHHSHTNQFHADPDLHHFTSLLRVHQQFPHASIYKNQTQFLYVAFCYAFVVFGTCFWVPWGMMQSGTLYNMLDWTDAPQQRPLRAASMLMHLIAYVGFIMIWPFFTHLPWYKAMVAVFVHIATSGLIFAMFSQINHLNEESIMITQDDHNSNVDDNNISNDNSSNVLSNQKQGSEQSVDAMNLKSSWAVAQVETSNNFATDSTLWHVLSNGLNLQIEHHLFPGLNHCHLHHIAPIVQATCQEYGVRYKSYETWIDVMGATLDWLHQLASSNEHDREGDDR
jgi:fatty acid desaturase